MKNELTMTLMCGLARCGKSTYAKKYAKDAVIVCPDRIRKLLFGHQFHRDAEDFVWAYAKGMVKLILEQGKNVLIDATNLNFVSREMWYRIAVDYKANIRVVWVKTSLKECRKRNANSPKDERLSDVVLDRMAWMFENPTEDSIDSVRYDITVLEEPYRGKYGDCGNIYGEAVLAGRGGII